MTLAQLATDHRHRLHGVTPPTTWAAAMAGIVDAEYDKVFADALFEECNQLADTMPIPDEVRGLVPHWAEILPLLHVAHEQNNATASDAPAYLASLLMKMGAAADAREAADAE